MQFLGLHTRTTQYQSLRPRPLQSAPYIGSLGELLCLFKFENILNYQTKPGTYIDKSVGEMTWEFWHPGLEEIIFESH